MSFSNSHILIVWYLSGILLSNLGAFDLDITEATLNDPASIAKLGSWVSPLANVMTIGGDERTTNFIRPSLRGIDKLITPSKMTGAVSQQVNIPEPTEPLQAIAVVRKEELPRTLPEETPSIAQGSVSAQLFPANRDDIQPMGPSPHAATDSVAVVHLEPKP